MLIDNTWVEISLLNCMVYKPGTRPLQLAYSIGIPTGEPTMGIFHNDSQAFPLPTGETLWARAPKGSLEILVSLME